MRPGIGSELRGLRGVPLCWQDRLGTVGNQFAVTMLLSWAISAPFVLLKEWNQLPMLVEAWTTNPIVRSGLRVAGCLMDMCAIVLYHAYHAVPYDATSYHQGRS